MHACSVGLMNRCLKGKASGFPASALRTVPASVPRLRTSVDSDVPAGVGRRDRTVSGSRRAVARRQPDRHAAAFRRAGYCPLLVCATARNVPCVRAPEDAEATRPTTRGATALKVHGVFGKQPATSAPIGHSTSSPMSAKTRSAALRHRHGHGPSGWRRGAVGRTGGEDRS